MYTNNFNDLKNVLRTNIKVLDWQIQLQGLDKELRQ